LAFIGILLNSIVGLIRYRASKLWDPSLANRVAARRCAVCPEFRFGTRKIYDFSFSCDVIATARCPFLCALLCSRGIFISEGERFLPR
jgi:hypothetical protein